MWARYPCSVPPRPKNRIPPTKRLELYPSVEGTWVQLESWFGGIQRNGSNSSPISTGCVGPPSFLWRQCDLAELCLAGRKLLYRGTSRKRNRAFLRCVRFPAFLDGYCQETSSNNSASEQTQAGIFRIPVSYARFSFTGVPLLQETGNLKTLGLCFLFKGSY